MYHVVLIVHCAFDRKNRLLLLIIGSILFCLSFGSIFCCFLLCLGLKSAFFCFLFPFTVSVIQEISVFPHDEGELVELLHHVHHALAEAGVLHAPVVVELLPGHGHAALVGGAGHAHPPGELAQLVHHVKRLRPAVHLEHDGRAPLGGPHAARVQGQPVDLVLEAGRGGAVHLGAHPHVALAPVAQRPQLLHLGVIFNGRISHGQAPGVVHAHVAAHALQQPRALQGQEAGERARLAQGAVQHQNTWWVLDLGPLRGEGNGAINLHLVRPVVAWTTTRRIQARTMLQPAPHTRFRVSFERVRVIPRQGV
mmetsp:Transcript_43282/g.76351  ORF Transcript_43282/g.76351 Transcript_43282/m.76351 type:complete len:309 (+) Transcript_43282:80-1006(+)